MPVLSLKYIPSRSVAYWLFASAFLVFLMVVVGGLTRLTASGLSMVEWKPITGAIPPLTEAAWLEEFTKYRRTPEYLAVNFTMTLTEFKSIFFLEYVHRLLGRVVGIVFFIPLIYFSVRKQLNKPLIISLAAIFVLGALQGLIGWYMVKSGLQHNPHVSHYRLALHLGMAFIIEGLLLWAAFRVWHSVDKPHLSEQPDKRLTLYLQLITGLIFFQVISGALVAGLHAGLIYNSFPLMDGRLIPLGMGPFSPWYKIFEDVTAVQFIHRLSALLVTLTIIALWIKVQCTSCYLFIKNSVNFLMIMLTFQLTLGIATLVYHVPIVLASLHQAGAAILFSLSVYCLFTAQKKVSADTGL